MAVYRVPGQNIIYCLDADVRPTDMPYNSIAYVTDKAKREIYTDAGWITQSNNYSMDTITQAINVIDYAHHEVHSGSHYFASSYDSDTDSGQYKYWLIRASTTLEYAHMSIGFVASGAGVVRLYEAPNLDTAGGGTTGSEVTTRNSNRNSSNTAGAAYFQDPTWGAAGSTGTLIDVGYIGSGGIGGKTGGGADDRDNEIILKQGERYIVSFTPESDNTKCCLRLSWYEHTNK